MRVQRAPMPLTYNSSVTPDLIRGPDEFTLAAMPLPILMGFNWIMLRWSLARRDAPALTQRLTQTLQFLDAHPGAMGQKFYHDLSELMQRADPTSKQLVEAQLAYHHQKNFWRLALHPTPQISVAQASDLALQSLQKLPTTEQIPLLIDMYQTALAKRGVGDHPEKFSSQDLRNDPTLPPLDPIVAQLQVALATTMHHEARRIVQLHQLTTAVIVHDLEQAAPLAKYLLDANDLSPTMLRRLHAILAQLHLQKAADIKKTSPQDLEALLHATRQARSSLISASLAVSPQLLQHWQAIGEAVWSEVALSFRQETANPASTVMINWMRSATAIMAMAEAGKVDPFLRAARPTLAALGFENDPWKKVLAHLEQYKFMRMEAQTQFRAHWVNLVNVAQAQPDQERVRLRADILKWVSDYFKYLEGQYDRLLPQLGNHAKFMATISGELWQVWNWVVNTHWALPAVRAAGERGASREMYMRLAEWRGNGGVDVALSEAAVIADLALRLKVTPDYLCAVLFEKTPDPALLSRVAQLTGNITAIRYFSEQSRSRALFDLRHMANGVK